jgi:hypothetical protein
LVGDGVTRWVLRVGVTVATSVGFHLCLFYKLLTILLQFLNAINECRSGQQNNVNFASDLHVPIYSGLMVNMKVMMNHKHHGAKLLEL